MFAHFYICLDFHANFFLKTLEISKYKAQHLTSWKFLYYVTEMQLSNMDWFDGLTDSFLMTYLNFSVFNISFNIITNDKEHKYALDIKCVGLMFDDGARSC